MAFLQHLLMNQFHVSDIDCISSFSSNVESKWLAVCTCTGICHGNAVIFRKMIIGLWDTVFYYFEFRSDRRKFCKRLAAPLYHISYVVHIINSLFNSCSQQTISRRPFQAAVGGGVGLGSNVAKWLHGCPVLRRLRTPQTARRRLVSVHGARTGKV